MTIEDIINEQTLDWLLETSNPSVRYYTLKKLLGKEEDGQELKEAKAGIMKSGIVPVILEKQNEGGFWGNRSGFYLEKYTGTVWQLIILAELGADGNNNKIRKACEFILGNSQDVESSGFAFNGSPKNGGRHSEVIPCLTGNMVYSLLKLGYPDERVKEGIEWITRYQRADDGIRETPRGWPYDRFENCFGKHTCHMGVVKSLKALSVIPKDQRTSAIDKKITELSEFLLLHHIYKKSHDLNAVAKPGWLRLGFPLMYQTDILEILEILTDLDVKDHRMNDAIEIVKTKQGKDGKWILENTFNGRMITNIEVKGKPSKWITLRAVNVLMKFFIRSEP